MKCRYLSWEVVHRIGLNPLLRVKIEMDFREDFKSDTSLLLLPPKYKVELYEVTKDLRGRGLRGIIDQGIGESAVFLKPASSTLKTHIYIPVSKELIDKINEIKRKGNLPAFNIVFDTDIVYYEHSAPSLRSFTSDVWKPVYGGEEWPLIIFTSDEVDLLMKDLKYVEVLRVEVPIPIRAEHIVQEKLVNSVKEVMVAKELLAKGEYESVLRTCRNVVMNYLTNWDPASRKRVLIEEIREYILSKVPKNQKSLYENVLNSLNETLYGLLQHLHKFIKEDTGKLMENPLRADAEYAFYTLFSVVKYLTELSLER